MGNIMARVTLTQKKEVLASIDYLAPTPTHYVYTYTHILYTNFTQQLSIPYQH